MAVTSPGRLLLLPYGMWRVLALQRDRGHVRAQLFLGICFGAWLRPDLVLRAGATRISRPSVVAGLDTSWLLLLNFTV